MVLFAIVLFWEPPYTMNAPYDAPVAFYLRVEDCVIGGVLHVYALQELVVVAVELVILL